MIWTPMPIWSESVFPEEAPPIKTSITASLPCREVTPSLTPPFLNVKDGLTAVPLSEDDLIFAEVIYFSGIP